MSLNKIVLAACLVAHASEGAELFTKPGATVTSDPARLPPAIESLGICIDALRINLPRVGQDFPAPQYPQKPEHSEQLKHHGAMLPDGNTNSDCMSQRFTEAENASNAIANSSAPTSPPPIDWITGSSS